ncbi:MAG: LamG domain-containing protein [Planctomycetota bacterium]|nr:LamG domain-containing protein [Planctomycetota bacterium]
MHVHLIAGAVLSLAMTLSGWAADYGAEVRKDTPLAWWRFQEPTTADGDTVKDETGQHAGLYRGGVKHESGPPGIGGRAARFDGQRAFIDVPHQAAFALDELSVEVWVRATQPWTAKQWPGSATLVSKATAGPGSSDWTINAGTLQAGQNEGRILTSTGAAGSGADANLASGQHLNDGHWHHVVWTRSSTGLNCLYVDGRLADQAEDEGGPIANDRPIQIGGDPLERGTFLDGALAEPALYAGVLTADRVQAHAVAGGLDVPLATPGAAAPTPPLESLALQNSTGLTWELWRGADGWSLGQIALHGKPLVRPQCV